MKRDQRSIVHLVTVAAVALLAVAPVGAETLDVSSTTLLAGRADPRDGKVYSVVPLHQMLSLGASDFKIKYVDDFKIRVSGWGAALFGDPRDDKFGTGDLDLGYLEGKLFKRHLTVRLGRQMVMGGVARQQQLDGALITLGIVKGLGITGYGGAPVTPRFGTHRGDAMGGTRLFYRFSINTEIGASFIHVSDRHMTMRQEAGLDARWMPHRQVTLSGFASMSTYEKQLSEASAIVSWNPNGKFNLSVDYRRTTPDLFIPRSSIFAVFADDAHDEGGAFLFWRPLPRLRITGDYHFTYNSVGAGHRGGGRIALQLGDEFQHTIAAESRVVKIPEGGGRGYVQARAFGMFRFSPWARGLLVTVDADTFVFDQDLNGQRVSFTGAATLGYEFQSGWRVLVAGTGDMTPQVEQRFEVMAKIAYNNSFRFRKVTP